MKEIFRIEVAALVVAVYSSTEPWNNFLSTNYRNFSSLKNPHIKIYASFPGRLPAVRGRRVFQLTERYEIYKHNKRLIFKLYAERDIAGHCYILKIDEKLKKARLYVPKLKSYRSRIVFDYPLDQLFFIYLFSKHQRLIQHGCGIDHNGTAYVFLGNSGAGKTTLSRILNRNGLTVLSDDRIILHKGKTRFTAYGSPWPGDGKFALPQGRPLQKVFFLCHGTTNRLVRLTPHKAAAELLKFSFIPFWNKQATRTLVGFCVSVAQEIPCFRLEFVPDDSVFEFLKKNL